MVLGECVGRNHGDKDEKMHTIINNQEHRSQIRTRNVKKMPQKSKYTTQVYVSPEPGPSNRLGATNNHSDNDTPIETEPDIPND